VGTGAGVVTDAEGSGVLTDSEGSGFGVSVGVGGGVGRQSSIQNTLFIFL
jgi:hypothetical protein